MRHVRQILAAGWAGTTLLLAACGGGGGSAPPTAAVPADEVTQASAMPMSADDQETGRPLDVAIQGDGLLVAHDPATGERVYTRWGRMDLDAEGYLVHAQGWRMGGVLPDDAAALSGDDLAGREQPLPPVPWLLPARPDTALRIEMNLDARAVRTAHGLVQGLSVLGAWAVPPVPYVFSASFTLIDARGRDRLLQLFFTAGLQDATDHSCVDVYASIDGRLVQGDAAGVWRQLCFAYDGSGVVQESAPLPLAWPAAAGDGVAVPRLEDLGVTFEATRIDGPNAITSWSRNGYGAGHLQYLTVQPDGTVLASYDNGLPVAHGVLALARPALGDRYRRTQAVGWRCAATCSTPTMARPGQRLTGTLRQGWLATSF